jgi:hypothetical protein
VWHAVPEKRSFMLSCCAGFDVTDLSEDAPDDIEGLDASAAHVANLLSTEPADSMFPGYIIFVCMSIT